MKNNLIILITLCCTVQMSAIEPPELWPPEDLFGEDGLFGQSQAFGRHASVLQFGIGFIPNHTEQFDARKAVVPPVSIFYEKSVMRNISLGAYVGFRMWRVPKWGYENIYVVGGLRAAYHLNVGGKLDPYFGISANYREGRVFDEGHKGLKNTKTDTGWMLGCRYYIGSKFGVFAEVGNDILTTANVGFCFRFNHDESW